MTAVVSGAVAAVANTFDTAKTDMSTSSNPVQVALDNAIARYETRNPQSKALHLQAVRSLPGGNTRTLLHVSPFPVFMKSGTGYQVTSEDGHTYTDLVGEMTAGLYGHSQPEILASIRHVLDNVGLNLGSTIAQEHLHASVICERFSLERVRFTNSGTEANLHALAGARAFTGKRKVVTFAGGYHGGVFGFAHGVPAPNNVDLADWVVARYNDVESAREAIKGEGVAAVLVEGMQGGPGAVVGSEEFLKGIEAAAKEAGVIFILDEVMTSRTSPGGLAAIYGLKPDLKSFGKYLGGGLAFGAFGGRADIMALYDPRLNGRLAHSGTFNNNTLVTHAGYVGLTKVFTPEVCTEFSANGNQLRERLKEVTKGTKMCFTGIGSIMASHFTDEGVETIVREGDVQEVQALKDLFWYEMLEDGFWVMRRGSIALILGTPQEELDRFVDCVAKFLKRHHKITTVA